MLHRPDQPHAPLDLAVVEHQARRRDLHGGSAGALVDQQHGARIGEPIQGLVQRHRTIALALDDGEQPRLRAGAGMGVDRAPVGDHEALGPQRLQPDIVGAGGDRAFDAGGQQLLERREQHVLQIDGQRQQAVEEGGDRRQLVLDAVGVHQLQAGGVLEGLKRAAFHLAPDQQHVELAERVAPVVAFEIVLGPEQALAASLALAARDRAERVEAARDRAQRSASPPSRPWRSAGTAAAAPGWCGWCGRDPGSPHRPSSRVRAGSGRAGGDSAPTARRGSCARCRRRPRRRGCAWRHP